MTAFPEPEFSDLDAMLADAPIAPPTLSGAVGRPAKCKKHPGWKLDEYQDDPQSRVLAAREICIRCGTEKDPIRSRRGKNSRNRGNAIERDVCALLGIPRVGQYGGSEDGGKSDSWLVIQVKSGGTYPERIDMLLRSLPVTAAQLRGVVHTDAPGPGKRRRMLISLDLKEFADWFGAVRAAKP